MPGFPELLWKNRDSSPLVWTTTGECREFLRERTFSEEWVWPKLAGNWGGHLHQSILRIALLDADDDLMTNITPVLLEVFNEDDDTKYGPVSRARGLFSRLDDYRRNDPTANPDLYELEGLMVYGTKGERPAGVLGEFTGKQREYLQDRYFYARNGLTGERLSPVEFPDDPVL